MKTISLKLQPEEDKTLNELKEYYKSLFGEQTQTWVIKQAIFQEWLDNVEIPRHNKKNRLYLNTLQKT